MRKSEQPGPWLVKCRSPSINKNEPGTHGTEMVMDHQVDVISSLPDDVLLLILSATTIRHAVRTSVLSKRWRDLWKCLLILDLSGDCIFEDDPCYNFVMKMKRRDQFHILRKRANSYCDIVNTILLHHAGQLRSFVVGGVFLDACYTSHINRWISFAAASGAKEFTFRGFDAPVHYSFFKGCDRYEFPSHLFLNNERRLSCVSLCYVRLRTPANFDSFNSMKSLSLYSVRMKGKHLHDLLSGCPVMVRLQLMSLRNIKVLSIYHSRLKILTIIWCSSLKQVQIVCPSLTTFEFEPYGKNLVLVDAPMVVIASLYSLRLYDMDKCRGRGYSLLACLIKLSQVQNLILACNEKIERELLVPFANKLCNLKRLVLSFKEMFNKDLHWVFSLLEAAPFLQQFELHLFQYIWNDENFGEWDVRHNLSFSHFHLTDITITGFCGSICHMQFAACILKNATALKFMTIASDLKYYSESNERLWKSVGCARAAPSWTRKMACQLESYLPVDVLLFLS